MKPELYSLVDLMGADLKGQVYGAQLRIAPNGDDPDFVFEIEKVLKTKKVKGKDFVLVKYLYYPDKFNQWIPKTNIVINNE